jgi:hypothetical protein
MLYYLLLHHYPYLKVMSNEYEAYTLAAGIAYGLVGLGQGSRIMNENVEHFMR